MSPGEPIFHFLNTVVLTALVAFSCCGATGLACSQAWAAAAARPLHCPAFRLPARSSWTQQADAPAWERQVRRRIALAISGSVAIPAPWPSPSCNSTSATCPHSGPRPPHRWQPADRSGADGSRQSGPGTFARRCFWPSPCCSPVQCSAPWFRCSSDPFLDAHRASTSCSTSSPFPVRRRVAAATDGADPAHRPVAHSRGSAGHLRRTADLRTRPRWPACA